LSRRLAKATVTPAYSIPSRHQLRDLWHKLCTINRPAHPIPVNSGRKDPCNRAPENRHLPRLRTNRPRSRIRSHRVRLAENHHPGFPNDHSHDHLRPIDDRLPILWRKVAGVLSVFDRSSDHIISDQSRCNRSTSPLSENRTCQSASLRSAVGQPSVGNRSMRTASPQAQAELTQPTSQLCRRNGPFMQPYGCISSPGTSANLLQCAMACITLKWSVQLVGGNAFTR
jgi:hypothetical protein